MITKCCQIFQQSGKIWVIALLLSFSYLPSLKAQSPHTHMAYVVSMNKPASHLYHVELTCSGIKQPNLYLNMCAWTPGFYEIIDFEKEVENFTAAGVDGTPVTWQKTTKNTWKVKSNYKGIVKISYDVKADNPFIANLNLDENYGYIIPGGLLMYLQTELRHPVTVQIKPYSGWPQTVATGLNPLPGKINTFIASNFDELYDSPLLIGKLEVFPATSNGGKPIQFIGYSLGNFSREELMANLKKIAVTGSNIIGDIPYNHYTFLAVGMNGHGFGGIEHLNSASLIVYNGNLLAPNFKENFYSFLAHEYFHTYNVKRIRPIALGPFDYSKENYTNLLWVSEGFTDYYEYLILNRAGLMSGQHAQNISKAMKTPRATFTKQLTKLAAASGRNEASQQSVLPKKLQKPYRFMIKVALWVCCSI
jgi:predicted metalloprotease with PDZ domain